ncbi:MAG: cytochrome b/b6 domain-containing protein [Deltaproteobacteria bacterium]|nr:cytochrome b/b6 domain-containing protein [Deltaproteobacteria bacterium]
MTEKIWEEKGLVVRHNFLELLEHWAIALSGFVLIITGLFQMPLANRYYISSLPGLAWSGDFIISLNVHYAASAIFVAAAFFHVIYHGILGERGMLPQKGDLKTSITVVKSFFGKGEEPPFHKYLPEQRLAYIGMIFIIAMLIISGLVKTYKNIYAPDLSEGIVFLATWVHITFFILFVLAFIGHMAAIILKPNRPMVRAIFTGSVRLDYARHRHPLWVAELEGGRKIPATVEPAVEEISEETVEAETVKTSTEPEMLLQKKADLQEADESEDLYAETQEEDVGGTDKTSD